MKRWIPTREAKPKEFITTGELNEVLYVVTRKTQELYLKDLVQELQEGKPIRSKVFIRLCPFLDSHGVVRVGGRLRRSNLSNDMKHPILIPIEYSSIDRSPLAYICLSCRSEAYDCFDQTALMDYRH